MMQSQHVELYILFKLNRFVENIPMKKKLIFFVHTVSGPVNFGIKFYIYTYQLYTAAFLLLITV